jgi:hypothetical protein
MSQPGTRGCRSLSDHADVGSADKLLVAGRASWSWRTRNPTKKATRMILSKRSRDVVVRGAARNVWHVYDGVAIKLAKDVGGQAAS